MPVFLDKLDFFKVTAADIGQIYMEGQKIRQEFGCYVLASWFDQKRKTTFYLIDAPDLESVKEMHCHLYHSYPWEIIQIKEDLIETFLSSIESPKSPTRNYSQQSHLHSPAFCAVMVIKLYSREPFYTIEYSRRKNLVEDFKVCLQKLIKKNNGRIIKSTWDGYMYFFDSIGQSLKAALQIQRELDVRIKINGENIMMLSIGIDCGRPINDYCDRFEETTNLARRLCCIAGNDQIVVSSIVKQQFEWEDWGTLVKTNNLKSLSYKDEQFFTRLMDIIELNYKEDLKMGEICRILGKSRSQLYRKIIEVTNLSPIALINEYRLKRASELMNMQKGENISQIAFEVGFNSLSYFSRRFKKRFGHLPKAVMNSTH